MRHPHNEGEWQTIREALLWASSFLQEAGTKDPRFEAELILRHCLRLDRTAFLARMADPFPAEAAGCVSALAKRRAAHEPVQYMLGEQSFYGREFIVEPGVLIPRPETEILVEQILLKAEQLWTDAAGLPLRVADIGTGSGAIALTLACERPNWQVSTVDLSTDALAIAGRNAERLGVRERVTFLQGDLLAPLLERERGKRLDILVSNPPYIPSEVVDGLDREVRDYEPRLALDGGEDGLECYRRLCAGLPGLLKRTALIGFEVGIDQAQDVAGLLMDSGVIDETLIIPDLAGIERVVLGWRLAAQD